MLAPGATIGILGGGQLGRMLALAAAQLGLKVHVFAPEANSCAFDVAAVHTCAAYEDERALAAFADSVDAITYEFENVPSATAAFLAARRPLHPNARALSVTQDRLSEKEFLVGLGLTTAPFRAVSSRKELEEAITALGLPAVLKTRRFGYDGKGQVLLRHEANVQEALEALNHQPAILEGFVPFTREASVVAARGQDGSFAAYDIAANTHKHHILDVTVAPATLASEAAASAIEGARRIAEALDYVGVFAVELFLLEDDSVVINEIAPRVHNSGHWTMEGAQTSQFAQHIRAVCGWPLGSTQSLGRAEMTNLIGEDITAWAKLLNEPGAHVHLYGKGEARKGRKMGHVTRVFRA